MCQDPFTKYRHDRMNSSGIMHRKCSIRSRRHFSRNNRRFSISKKTGPRLFICIPGSFLCAVDPAKRTIITYTLATRHSSSMLRMDRSRDCLIWWSSDRLTECAAWLTLSTAAVVWIRGGARWITASVSTWRDKNGETTCRAWTVASSRWPSWRSTLFGCTVLAVSAPIKFAFQITSSWSGSTLS